MAISTEIRVELLRHSMNVSALADAVKMPRSSLNRKLSGVTDFTLEEISKISKVFGLEDWELIRRGREIACRSDSALTSENV